MRWFDPACTFNSITVIIVFKASRSKWEKERENLCKKRAHFVSFQIECNQLKGATEITFILNSCNCFNFHADSIHIDFHSFFHQKTTTNYKYELFDDAQFQQNFGTLWTMSNGRHALPNRLATISGILLHTFHRIEWVEAQEPDGNFWRFSNGAQLCQMENSLTFALKHILL